MNIQGPNRFSKFVELLSPVAGPHANLYFFVNPQYKEVKVQRILPNEIKVVLKRRLPFASIRLVKTYWIDSTSVVLSKDAGDGGEYPLILGVPKPKKKVTTGSRIHFQALDQAIQILRDIQKKDILQNHRLAHLDISDTRNFVLWIDKKIEIRMGSRNWAEKLNKLAEAIGTLDIHPDKVRYIDLRFDDIIIGPR